MVSFTSFWRISDATLRSSAMWSSGKSPFESPVISAWMPMRYQSSWHRHMSFYLNIWPYA